MCKIMNNNEEEVSNLLTAKLAIKYKGPEIDAMKVIFFLPISRFCRLTDYADFPIFLFPDFLFTRFCRFTDFADFAEHDSNVNCSFQEICQASADRDVHKLEAAFVKFQPQLSDDTVIQVHLRLPPIFSTELDSRNTWSV